MSTSATDSTTEASKEAAATTVQKTDASPKDKGKGKATTDDAMMEDEDEVEDDDDDDEEDDEEEEEDDEEDEDEDMEAIDPSAILSTGRRTRGKQVDYTSEEALAKAGLKKTDLENDDEEMK